MGYVCPVCEDPQSDGHHLANHLAFTAMLGDTAHEEWLEARVPDWAETDPEELAPQVTDHAAETEFPQVFEDTTGGTDRDDGHAHGDAGAHTPAADLPSTVDEVSDPSALFEDDDVAASDVLAEARELTRRKRAGTDDGEDDGESSADGS